MRLSIVVDGKPESVEVDLSGSTVAVGEQRYPFKVVSESPLRLELEVGGEKVVVEGWPQGLPRPPGPVDVNGERWHVTEVRVETLSSAGSPSSARSGVGPPAPAPTVAAGPPSHGRPAEPDATGMAVVPPMPGKIIEIRVHEGDRVTRGQVLVVLEAMKMRNEVPSPVAGRVTRISVSAGSNVRARETMIQIEPD